MGEEQSKIDEVATMMCLIQGLKEKKGGGRGTTVNINVAATAQTQTMMCHIQQTHASTECQILISMH